MAVEKGIQARAAQNRQPNEEACKNMRLSSVAHWTSRAAAAFRLPTAARGLALLLLRDVRAAVLLPARFVVLAADLLLFAVADGLQSERREPPARPDTPWSLRPLPAPAARPGEYCACRNRSRRPECG